MDYTYDIEVNGQEFTVNFIAEPRWDNDGIGRYEYGGATFYDQGHDFVTNDWKGIEIDQSKHTPEQIKLIEQWLSITENAKALDKFICEQFKQENQL